MKLILALCLPLLSSAHAAMPEEGEPAPAFTLDSQEGKPVSLSDYEGKWVVLYFYPKDFTGGCTLEAHQFQEDLPRYEKKNAVVLGVSTQSAESHKSFCEKEGLSFKLLADVEHKVSKAYGSIMNLGLTKLSARNTFLIGPDGVLRKRFLKVKPAKHSAQVLSALAELQK